MKNWLLGLMLATGLAQAEPMILTGTLTHADHNTYREVPFEVPAGTEAIYVKVSHDGQDDNTVIDLGMYDPFGFRGWSGGNKTEFYISQFDATPSYRPGPILHGTWHLILGLPNVSIGVETDFRAEITLINSENRGNSTEFHTPISTERGWYRGDFHAHTGHSDGSCTSLAGNKVPCPVHKTLDAALEAGLDFVSVTDHNTLTHQATLRELAPYYDTIAVIAGREVTTFNGHANVFSANQPTDFQLGSNRLPTLSHLYQQVEDQNALISINHPGRPTGAECMGCGWNPPGNDYSRVDAIEIVNTPQYLLHETFDHPLSGIPFWEQKLEQGYRIIGIGGSDNHEPDVDYGDPKYRFAPVTVVKADSLSQADILDAVRVGRIYLDLALEPGRLIDIEARNGNQSGFMGDTLTANQGDRIELTFITEQAEGLSLELITSSGLTIEHGELQVNQSESQHQMSYTSDGERSWVRANLRDSDGRLVMVSNPVFINFD
ncbi:CehA/McbA family metallohydrolase [Ferrimonas pelagia]|uniref:CehA/McbA family metallohydrolase n=1 Tax=Ferrimonas pelagia TaxID=1177826 RepID=A0ABP9FFM9_9GAMM